MWLVHHEVKENAAETWTVINNKQLKKKESGKWRVENSNISETSCMHIFYIHKYTLIMHYVYPPLQMKEKKDK